MNPIGYVFITLFVLLSAWAAFWPNEFFIANLANLDQLNKVFPLIMLVFVPAITMSIWAEERRQGTDELLLTMPATDFDVVIGKYLAAVAIYSISLAFSFVSNLVVLVILGDPDLGLFVTNYLGYWLVGLAMLAVGMVASFLTTNITVAFVLSAAFNLVLVGLAYVNRALPPDLANRFNQFSISEQMRDFTQGVISLSSTAYFLLIVVTMLYLSMVLIGRRHWLGGRDGTSLAPHYLTRFLAMACAAAGLFLIIQSKANARADLTAERLTSLAPSTKELLGKLDSKKPVVIHAFISPNVPQEYVPIKLDLLSRLREIKAVGGTNVTLYVNDTEPLSPEADRAERAFGITGREVGSVVRGKFTQETIFLGVALVAGLDKMVIPFVEPSTPIEYELVRSISTLNGAKPKRLGLFVADKQSFQEFDPQTRNMRDPEILVELRKQYDVVDVNVNEKVADNIDVLMAIQPSLLGPEQLDHLVDAIRRGVPTAVFQDPEAYYYPAIQQAEMRQGGGAPYIQDVATQKLWDLLGVTVPAGQIVNQYGYNPLKHLDELPPEFVFIGNGAIRETNAKGSLFDEQDPISRGTQELVFMYAGSVAQKKGASLKFTPLVRTSPVSGYVEKSELFIGGQQENPRAERFQTGVEYTLVAHVTGQAPAEKAAPKGTAAATGNKAAADEQAGADGGSQKPADAASAPKNEVTPAATGAGATAPTAAASATATAAPAKAATTGSPSATATGSAAATASASPTATPTATAAKPAAPKDMNVVVFSDLDVMTSVLFRLRSQRAQADEQRTPNFDNVAFVLNALDVLAGDTKFVDLRKRRPEHRTLTRIDELHEKNAKQLKESENAYREQTKSSLEQLTKSLNDEEEKLRKAPNLKEIDREGRLAIFQNDRVRRFNTKQKELETRYDKEKKELQRELNERVLAEQGGIKGMAVFIPPIFPLLIGLAVFFSLRAGEQEGVSRSRLR
jgi:ABC-2 type transport system permease protein